MTDRHQDIQDLLNDYTDGYLKASDVRVVETHLEDCEVCRSEVASLRSLLAEARGLPQEMTPARDLWPGIEAALSAPQSNRDVPSSATPGNAQERRRRFAPFAWGGLAAAATVAVILMALPRNPAPVLPPDSTTAAVDLPSRSEWAELHRSMESECMSTGRLVMATCQSRENMMEPVLAADIGRGLHTLDASIAETVAALEANPDDPYLMEMLTDRYRQKLSLLKKTLTLSRIV